MMAMMGKPEDRLKAEEEKSRKSLKLENSAFLPEHLS
jgi:hypothetical protein